MRQLSVSRYAPMSRNLINLLPLSRVRAFRRAYFARLGVVALVMLAALIVVHTVLLLPSYLYLGAEASARQSEAARLRAELTDAEGSGANQELDALSSEAARLARLKTAPTASHTMRVILDVPRSGVTLRGISYTPPVGEAANGKVTLQGDATTRSALQAYERALRGVPGVASVELPVGAYANDADIAFTVTLTGAFRP